MKPNKLTMFILAAMLLGVLTGYTWREIAPSEQAIKEFSSSLSLIIDVFLRFTKMLIAPLVFCTLVSGIAKMGDGKTVGRTGGKALLWFFSASLLSLVLGLVMVNLLQPGAALQIPLPDVHAQSGIQTNTLSFSTFIVHAVPVSIMDAMAKNEILQIVVFALFFGSAIASLGETAKPLVRVLDVLANVMLRVTGYVMNLAPLAVFAAIASIVASQGLGIIAVYGQFMGKFYLSIGVLWIVLILIGSLFLGRRILALLSAVKGSALLAFATATSEAAFPKLLEQLTQFGCSKKISSFVLPLGYSFNLDGSMMYCTFATLFIAQAYGIEISVTQQISMLIILMLTSKGMAGIPRASLVVIAATLSQFNIPDAGLLLLFGVDHFLDMGRSATNVIGNSIAAAVVAKWEGELEGSTDSPAFATLAAESSSV